MKKYFYWQIQIISILLFNGLSVRAEYVIFEESIQGRMKAMDECYWFEKIDELRRIYQFPMSINPVNEASISALSEIEKKLMDENEEEFLQGVFNQKLEEYYKQKNQQQRKVRLVYIPNTLYELLVIGGRSLWPLKSGAWDKNQFAATMNSDSLLSYPADQVWGKLSEAGAEYSNVVAKCLINQKIGERLLKLVDPADLLDHGKWKVLKESILSHEQTEFRWPEILLDKFHEGEFEPDFLKKGKIEDFLANIIDDEAELNFRGEIPLYRGAMTRNEDPKGTLFWSQSYGMTLFGGFNDKERSVDAGACAWSYIVNKNYYGMRLGLKKNLIRTKQVAFYIPPLDVLTGMLSKGEYFHARTKVQSCSPSEDKCKGLFHSLSRPEVKFLVETGKNKDEIVAELATYPRKVIKEKGLVDPLEIEELLMCPLSVKRHPIDQLQKLLGEL